MEKNYLKLLINQGNSTYSIARLTNKSQTGIMYWLRKYDLKTTKIKNSYKFCIVCNKKTIRGNKHCPTCRVKLQRLRYKIALINYKGGKCKKCGLTNFVCLDFHHKDRNNKKFNISEGVKSWNRLKKEVDKCDLLCSNCHRIKHNENDYWQGLENDARKYQGQNQDIIKYLNSPLV